jgi:hypothetical protein
MLTAQIGINCIDGVKAIKDSIGDTDTLYLDSEVVEELIDLNGHMTRLVEEFLEEQSKEQGLIMERCPNGYRWTRPVITHTTEVNVTADIVVVNQPVKRVMIAPEPTIPEPTAFDNLVDYFCNWWNKPKLIESVPAPTRAVVHQEIHVVV